MVEMVDEHIIIWKRAMNQNKSMTYFFIKRKYHDIIELVKI